MKKALHMSVIIIIVVAIVFTGLMFALRYHEKGETNMPFDISKISIISSTDGQNVEEVYKTAQKAVKKAREGRPYFIQAQTYRFNEHAEGEYYYRMRETNYRDNEELDKIKKEKCPIKLYENFLTENKMLDTEQINQMHKKAIKEIEKAVEYALNS